MPWLAVPSAKPRACQSPMRRMSSSGGPAIESCAGTRRQFVDELAGVINIDVGRRPVPMFLVGIGEEGHPFSPNTLMARR